MIQNTIQMSIQCRSDFRSMPAFYLLDEENESISNNENSIFCSLLDKLYDRD